MKKISFDINTFSLNKSFVKNWKFSCLCDVLYMPVFHHARFRLIFTQTGNTSTAQAVDALCISCWDILNNKLHAGIAYLNLLLAISSPTAQYSPLLRRYLFDKFKETINNQGYWFGYLFTDIKAFLIYQQL